MINTAESIRAQLVSWRTVTGTVPADVSAAAADVEKQLLDIESLLVNLTATGRGQDFLRTPGQMLDKLTHLADVVSYADFAPTDSQAQVDAKLSQEIAHEREQMDGVVARTLARFNALLRERQLGAIVARPEFRNETVSENQNVVEVWRMSKSDTFVSIVRSRVR